MRLRPVALARGTAIAGKVSITTHDAQFPQDLLIAINAGAASHR